MATENAIRPRQLFCTEKWRLLDEFVAAAREIVGIQSRRTAALTGGDDDLGEFDRQLELARARKDAALETYTRHIEAHGC